MGDKSGYIPPKYLPLDGSDPETGPNLISAILHPHPNQWSSGICACFDDPKICCLGTICPCILFGKNAEALGTNTLEKSCISHCLLWGLLGSVSCFLTGGVLLVLMPGCTTACCASKYRSALREKYNLPETPCNDYCTHFCCHLCALCQESREIHHRLDCSDRPNVVISPPQVQTMH